CGYDFSLTSVSPPPDLTIRRDDGTPSPLDDLALIDAAVAPLPPRMTDVGAEVDNLLGESDLAASATHRVGASENPANRVRRGVAASPGELPLFGKPIPDDQPLITRASPPRAPLAVRRSTPDVPRVRAEAPRAATLDLALDVDGDVAADPVYAAQVESSEAVPSAGTDPRDAPVAARFLAVVVDIGILAVIDAVV